MNLLNRINREDYWSSKDANNGNSTTDTATKGQATAPTTTIVEPVSMDDGDIDMIE